MRRFLIVTSAALTVVGCAPAGSADLAPTASGSASAPRACFRPSDIVNFREGSSQSLYLRSRQGDVFEVASAGCLDVGVGFGLSITPLTGISDRLCVDDSARIVGSSQTFPSGPCQARIVRSLTAAEIAALPSRDRP